MNRFLVLIAGLLALCAAVFIGCGGSDDDGGTDGGSGDPVRLGLIQPFTGESSYYGEAGDNALALAFEDYFDEIDGRQIEVVRGDSKCEPSAAVQAGQQVVSEDPVAVLLPACSGDTLAIKPLLKTKKIPGCSNNLSPDIVEPGDEFIWLAEPADNSINPLLAEYMANQGVTRVGVIHDTTAYGQTNSETIIAGLEDNGVEIAAQASYEFGDTDYAGQILKIKKAGIDAAYMSGYQLQIGNLIRQARKLGLDVPIYVNEDALGPTALEAAGDAIEDDVYIATTWLPTTLDAAIDFDKRWQEKYGEAATVPVVGMYECAAAVLTALESVGGDASGEDIDQAMADVKLEGMPSGTVEFDPETRERKDPPVMIGQIKNGKQELVEVLSGADWAAQAG